MRKRSGSQSPPSPGCATIAAHFLPGHGIKLYQLLGNIVFYLLAIFIVGMWVAPDTFYRLTHGGEEARLGGLMLNPNELGMLAGVGVACLIFNFY